MNRNLLLLVCLLPIFGYGQIIRPTPNIVEPNPGSYIHQLNNPTAFVTNAGTASASQQINFTTAQLSTSVVWTAGAGLEISKDNSTWSTTLTYANVVPSGSDHFFVRVAASTNAGSYSGNITAVSSPATANVPYSATVNAVPTISASPSSFTGMTSTAGNLGGSVTSLVTGSSLVGNLTVGPLGGFKVSLNNSTFATTQTITPSSGAVSQNVYIALSDTNTSGVHSGNLPISGGGASTFNIAVSGTTSATATTPDSVRIQFDTTSVDVANWIIMKGDPTKRVITVSLPGTTISVTSVSTATANWAPFCPSSCYATEPNNGYLTGQTLPYSGATGVMAECWYNFNAYGTTNPQIIVSGLNPAFTYDVEMSAGLAFPFNNCGQYNVKGAALQSNQGLCAYQNTTNKVKWTSIAPDGSGNFTIYFGHNASGEQMACLSYIRIVKH